MYGKEPESPEKKIGFCVYGVEMRVSDLAP
jgi:hypothetical protein